MGGKSKSSSKTSSTTNNYSLQGLEGDGVVVQGTGNTVTATDHNAIEAAFDFSESALGSVFNFGMEALETNEQVTTDALQQNADLVSQTFENSKDTTEAIKELALASDGSIEALKNQTKTIYVLGGVVVLALILMIIVYRKRT